MTATFEQTQNELGRLLDIASTGEEIVITRAGHPIAKLTALPQNVPQNPPPDREAWLAKLRLLREQYATGKVGSTSEEIFEDIRADRF